MEILKSRMPKYKLVCFDVDGTLVDNVIYSWELFHNYFDVDMKKREELVALNKKVVETAYSHEVIGKQIYEVITSAD